MSELVAVEGLTLADDTAGNTTTVAVAPTAVPSTKVKAEGKGVYAGGLDIQIASGSGVPGSCVLAAPVLDTIDPTAAKTKAEGALVMRQEDSKTIQATGVPPGGGSCPLTFTIRISDAGQTKVKAE